MIVFLDGSVDHVTSDSVYVNVSGVGYQVFVPISVLSQIQKGVMQRFYTYQHVREDDLRLFGFMNVQDLEIFKLLISVNGVGPKAGIGILSAYSSDDIISAIQRDDERLFASVSGVGKKGAAKIVIDLKNKVNGMSVMLVNGQDMSMDVSASDDLVNALMVLGYSEKEVYPYIKQIDKEAPIQKQIKQMLGFLGK